MAEAWKKWEGQVVNGEFHLLQYLGGSDNSAVFLTERREGEPQKAAIKLIPEDPANAELQLSRWRLAAKLSHPHLLRLFEMGRCRLGDLALLYVVMEYAEEDLSQVLPQRPLTPEEAREMLAPALDALAYLHGKGLVHARLKPANIMALNDQLKLSSDGLCRMGESSSGPGKPGVYDPPEAASMTIWPAADVWSLGMTLVEVLTQRLPVWQPTGQGEPVLPENVPAAFLEIARRCLHRDPQRRCTVADIAARLQQPSPVPHVRAASSPAPPLTAPKQQTTARPQRTFAKWRYVAPAVAVGLVLAAVLAVPRLLNRRPESQRTPSIPSGEPRRQSHTDRKPATPETTKSTQGSGNEKQRSSRNAPSPASLRSEAGAKAPPGGPDRGEVLQQVLPDVPQTARDTIHGTLRVSVRVHVDRSGNVVGATFDSPGPSKYFANLALQAAQRWEFAPPKVDGRSVSSEWILRFDFDRIATKAYPTQAVP